MRLRGSWWVVLAIALVRTSHSYAEQPAGTGIETVTVVGATPLSGTGIAADRLPESIETLTASDLAREGTPSLATALNDQAGAININDNLDDPFQPDILYHGFEASPVLGTPEGLAVYQSGVRINEAFGDAVNWDLIPDIAVKQISVISADPAYGLNALGGAVSIGMKNGFDYSSGELQLYGGSWGRRAALGEFGRNDGRFGIYVAVQLQAEDGWREFSPNSLAQFFGAASFRSARWSVDAALTAADNSLDGESPAPIEELNVDRSLVFTSPQSNRNRLLFPTVNAAYAASTLLSLQANLYFREFRQSVVNGNTTDYTSCAGSGNAGFLCQPDATTLLLDTSGAPIPDLSDGGTNPIGEIDFEDVATDSYGGALQVTDTGKLFARDNYFSAGASIDHDRTDFGSQAEIGAVNATLQVVPSGTFVSTPEGVGFTATPVGLHAINRYYGAFTTDTFGVTPDFAVTASGRYNVAQIALMDQRGKALSGASQYARVNPALGATEALSSNTTVYAGYSEGARTPTPGEIECADPSAPCVLPSSLSSDPPTLKQVVSHTWEAGFRGKFGFGELGATAVWQADLFRTELDDDIYGVASSLSSGYFRNIGPTRREGADLSLSYTADRASAFASYGFVDASFESSFVLPSPFNAGADEGGDIHVRPGDHLPGIPAHRFKAGADYRITTEWSAGAVLVFESSQYFRGDESNQMKPLAGFATVNFHSSYALGSRAELFVQVFNLLNARYATFGELGDPTGVGAPGIPEAPNAAVDHRFVSPAAPRCVFGGVRLHF